MSRPDPLLMPSSAPKKRGAGDRAAKLVKGAHRSTPPAQLASSPKMAGSGVPPRSVLFVRSDSYGDLLLFAPALAWLQCQWPDTRLGLILKSQHEDVRQLLPTGVEYLPTAANPGRETVAESPHVETLMQQVRQFDPEVLVAPSYEKTWLHAVAAAAAGKARRISVGPARFDPLTKHWLTQHHARDAAEYYPVVIDVAKSDHELEKHRRLLAALTCAEPPALVPGIQVPASALEQADRLLAKWKLPHRGFVICNPGGQANVAIKSWPPKLYGEVVAWLARTHGVPVLLCTHVDEKDVVDEVVRSAGPGVNLNVWLGSKGELPVLAALLSRAKFCFGNDTSTVHLAEGVGTPTVTVYGGGTWPRFLPSLPASIAIVQPLPCFGCDWDCHFGDAPCVKLIPPADVIKSIARLIGHDSAKNRPGPAVVEVGSLGPAWLQAVARSRALYQELQQDRAARYAQIMELTTTVQLAEQRFQSEAESGASVARALRQQNEQLSTLINERERRLAELDHALGEASELSRRQLAEKEKYLTKALADNEQLAGQVRSSAQQLAELDKQLKTLNQVTQRESAKLGSLVSQHEAESNARLAQVRELTSLVAKHEADATARLAQVHELTALATRHEADATARLSQIEELTALVKLHESASAERASQVAALSAELRDATAARVQAEQNQAETRAAAADYHDRLDAAERGLSDYRIENDRLAREIALLRRLITMSSENIALADAPLLPTTPVRSDNVVFNIESVLSVGGQIQINGWAFSPEIDSAQASIHLWLCSESDCRLATATPVSRPDVRAHFSGADAAIAIPAQGMVCEHLDRAGFRCTIVKHALAPGQTYAVHLQIEGPQFSVRKPTGVTLHD